jgi:tetratricopeptide (TPR) repeat protein
MRAADFESARQSFDRCVELQASAPLVERLRLELYPVEESYCSNVKKAIASLDSKELESAREFIECALKTCPKAEETKAMREEVRGRLARLDALLSEAVFCVENESFDEACNKLEEAETLSPRSQSLRELVERVNRDRAQYQKLIKACQQAKSEDDPGMQELKLKGLLEICPTSSRLKGDLLRIQATIGECNTLWRDASQYLRDKNYKSCGIKCRQLIQAWPCYPEARETLALVERKIRVRRIEGFLIGLICVVIIVVVGLYFDFF